MKSGGGDDSGTVSVVVDSRYKDVFGGLPRRVKIETGGNVG